ncbi:hypothetical protein Q5H91_07410 [Sphingomonas sp. KR1UV-12]|uniref:DUF5666 domain-containing protein n=1 Tax=Sphingomonas aurea TaxID=3063994 RepID=A0ABT9EJC5_9SPHN|nr:hypothetical protein [Sphingomonas sp. KR1UV-12]MDP1027034.1 hypothetical protein [Sphingomonas sp. KR1UV-12]
MKVSIFACAVLLASSAAVAQTGSPIMALASGGAVLRTGTEVPLKLSEMLTTKGKKLKSGQRVHLEVAEPVLVNGVVVIPAGSPAMGEITDVRNKGMWGKSGHLSGRVLYTTVNGRQLRLTGVFDDKGVAGGVGAVATSAVLIPVAGFFMTGTSAKLEVGTPVRAFMDEDVQLAMPAAGPGPMAVGAPAASQAAPATLTTISTPAK